MPERPTKIVTHPDLPPWQIEWHAELESTMDRARGLALAGAPAGTVVVADFQSKGRGTRGRPWIAPPGTCLMFTFIIRGDYDAAYLSALPGRVAELAAGVLRRNYGLGVEVKPPNDLLVGERKLAGVLCMSQVSGERSQWAICGLGINTSLSAAEAVVPNSTSLRMEGIEPVSHARLLERLLAEFDTLRQN